MKIHVFMTLRSPIDLPSVRAFGLRSHDPDRRRARRGSRGTPPDPRPQRIRIARSPGRDSTRCSRDSSNFVSQVAECGDTLPALSRAEITTSRRGITASPLVLLPRASLDLPGESVVPGVGEGPPLERGERSAAPSPVPERVISRSSAHDGGSEAERLGDEVT